MGRDAHTALRYGEPGPANIAKGDEHDARAGSPFRQLLAHEDEIVRSEAFRIEDVRRWKWSIDERHEISHLHGECRRIKVINGHTLNASLL